MQQQPFLQLVLERLETGTPPELRPWHARQRHAMLQIHYGNPRVHYELWLQGRSGRAELGLHFEDEPERNQRWCAVFAARALELLEALGPTLELEDWTASWTRLHLTVPLRPLDAEFAAELAETFGRLIACTAADLRRGIVEAAIPRSGHLAPGARRLARVRRCSESACAHSARPRHAAVPRPRAAPSADALNRRRRLMAAGWPADCSADFRSSAPARGRRPRGRPSRRRWPRPRPRRRVSGRRRG